MRKLLPLFPLLLFSAEPLPQDRGAAGLYQALKKISTMARVLYIQASPGQEDGGTIATLSRGLGADLTLLSLSPATLAWRRSAQEYGCRLRVAESAEPAAVARVIDELKPHVIIAQSAFPGMESWTAPKLYLGGLKESDDWTLAFDSGAYDPFLGLSYAQLARATARPGSHVAFYKRLKGPGPAKEAVFFDGIEDRIAVPAALKEPLDRAWANFTPTIPAAPSRYLALGLNAARELKLTRTAELWERAFNMSLALRLDARVDSPAPLTLATPGQVFDVVVELHNQTRWPIRPTAADLLAPPGWKVEKKDGGRWTVTVPADAVHTQAPPLLARVSYESSGGSAAIESEVNLSVGPALSLNFVSDNGALPAGKGRYRTAVMVRNLGIAPIHGELKLDLPKGWRSNPPSVPFAFEKQNAETTANFDLTATPAGGPEFTIGVVATSNGRQYRTTFLPESLPDIDTVWTERPALQTIRRAAKAP